MGELFSAMDFLRAAIFFSWLLSTEVIAQRVTKMFKNPMDSDFYPFQRMVVERRYTGRVYLGAVNRLYQFSADLDKQAVFETGPADDSPDCASSGICDSVKKHSIDNYNKAMTLYEKANKLIVCGSIRQGACRLHNVYNVSSLDPPISEAIVANDKDSSSVVFVAPGPPDPATTEVLNVASTYTDSGPFRDEVPAVATLSLQPENLFKIAHRNINSESQVLMERSKRKLYRIEYVYGFASGNYSYFASRQPVSSDASTSPYHSKLIRLCQRDKFYYSYTEVPLECRDVERGINYNLLQAAHIGKAGYDLARNLSISIEDDVLFAVFAKSLDNESNNNKPSRQSALCVYSMKYVEAKFAENIRECAKGEINRGLSFIRKDSVCLKTALDNLCGSEVNYPLGGSIPILKRAIHTSDNASFSAVTSSTVHMYTVAFIGTDNGQLKKFIVESDEIRAQEYDSMITDKNHVSILDVQLDISNEFMYVLTAETVSKIRLHECEKYERCSSCLSAKDPYCGWCASDNKCSSKPPCDGGQSVWLNFKENQCTEITNVTPNKIAVQKAEYLNLDIQNLPNFNGQLSCVYSIGSTKLIVGAQRMGPKVVQCNTPQPNQLPSLPGGSAHLKAQLSVQIDNGADFAATNFTFFDCSTYETCSQCANSTFPCDWCSQTSSCSHESETVCVGQPLVNSWAKTGQSERRGPLVCPRIVGGGENGGGGGQIFAPSGAVKQINVKVANLMPFQIDFVCRFEFENSRNFEVSATLNKASQNDNVSSVDCSRVNLSYTDVKAANFTAMLNILWKNPNDSDSKRYPLDNPDNVKVIIYKCEQSADNCGLCVNLDPSYECGWCPRSKKCTTFTVCQGQFELPINDWLNKSALCPNPTITDFYPKSGPVEGGTKLTIEGVNLGRSFSDIQNNVRVNQVPCTPLKEFYQSSSRIVCVTGNSLLNKPTYGQIVIQIRNAKGFLGFSDASFNFVDPIITGFSPLSGPQSGGTILTIEGDFLDAGSDVNLLVAGVPCTVEKRQQKSIQCRTTSSTLVGKQGGILMNVDKAVRSFVNNQFTFEQDPIIYSLNRDKSIVSGGLPLEVKGYRFNTTQNARLRFVVANRSFQSICSIETNEKMICYTPSLSSLLNDHHENFKFPVKAEFVFLLDNAELSKNFTLHQSTSTHLHHSSSNPMKNNRIIDSIDIYADPILYDFSSTYSSSSRSSSSADANEEKRKIKPYSEYLIVPGENLDQAVQASDLKIKIGSNLLCEHPMWQAQAMTCKLPTKQQFFDNKNMQNNGALSTTTSNRKNENEFGISNDVDAPANKLLTSMPEAIVIIGENGLNISLGFINYEDPAQTITGLPNESIFGIAAAILLLLISIVVLLFWYRRKSSFQRNQMKRLKDQIDSIELKVASECKEAFAELQTDMTELTAADVGCSASSSAGIPFLSYRDYAMQVLFPGQTNHPVVKELDIDPKNRPFVDKGLQLFNQLLTNKNFLILMLRTMESNRYFVSQSRVAVGSLLMVILQEKMEYCTEVLKTLLADLIQKTMEKRCQPKILFRRSESVAERMLGIWFTLLLYRYMIDCAGQPLFMLFWAIKQQVEKGPQDAVTYESRYSLSEEKLIRQTVDFHALTVYVSSFVETGSGGSTETPVRVFDCDTVTQVKEKCLDAIFKTTPYSRRPSPQEVDLEWRTGVSGRLILTDFNTTTKVEPGNWRKINTLGHYKVPNNASLALIPKQISVYNMSLLSERSDKSSTFSLKNVVGGNAVANSPTLNGVRGHNNNNKDGYGTKDSQEMNNYNKVYHLIKPTHDPYSSPQENSYNLERSLHNGGAKMMSEIYLTRLLTTKGTLQKFVEDLFEAIFTTTYRGSVLPVCVKYMFDFMDEQALQHGITDPEVVHTWKSNSLPLRFWVNILKNPHFVFDIARPVKIEGCLSVVAQTLMDSCSTQDPQLTKDSPSSKLLFARDIHTYRGWVEEYYKDIQELPIIADQDMSAYLNDESHCHMGEFNIASALYELYNNYVKIYGGEQLLSALENDESSRKNRLPAKYTQLLQLMDGQTTSTATTGHLQYDEFHSNRSSSHVPSAGCYTYGDVSLPR